MNNNENERMKSNLIADIQVKIFTAALICDSFILLLFLAAALNDVHGLHFINY